MKTKDVARATLLVALAVALSPLSIPVAGTRMFPAQSLVNVVAAALLGPWYAVAMAFVTSLIRNLLGTGTINAFAGSMIGALLAGLAWRATRNVFFAALGEIIGTGVIAVIVTVYIVAPTILRRPLNLSIIAIGFLASAVAGSIAAILVVKGLAAIGYVREGRAGRRTASER